VNTTFLILFLTGVFLTVLIYFRKNPDAEWEARDRLAEHWLAIAIVIIILLLIAAVTAPPSWPG
jgi:heme/copper-type cytochrome/quinol oxidase subunit 2